jgi:hypothetical protein
VQVRNPDKPSVPMTEAEIAEKKKSIAKVASWRVFAIVFALDPFQFLFLSHFQFSFSVGVDNQPLPRAA